MALTPHRPNYILPVTYLNNADFSPYATLGDVHDLEDLEVKYQLSMRTVLWPQMFGSRLEAWFAFTLLLATLCIRYLRALSRDEL